MKRILPFLFVLFGATTFAQTYQTWRSEATDNIWQTNGNWWNFPNGSPIVFGQQEWDNNHQPSQQSNANVNTWRFLFKAGANQAHTFSGNRIRFFDFDGQNPTITNISTATHTIGNNIEGDGDVADPLEIYAYDGNLNFTGAINNMGSWLDFYGNAGRNVSLSGSISGSAGLAIKSNITVTLSGSANSYTGVTTIESGTLVVQKGGHSASITTGAIAFTFASPNQAAGVYDFLPGQLGGSTSRTLTSNLAPGKSISFNYATGDVTICDTLTITAASIASNNPINSAFAKSGDVISLTFTTSEAASVTPTVTINGTAAAVTGSGTSWTATLSATGLSNGLVTFSISYQNALGCTGSRNTVTDSSSVTVDTVSPTVNTAVISSNNANSSGTAVAGDVVTLSFTTSEVLSASPVVSLNGVSASVTGSGTTWSATTTVANCSGATVPFSIAITDRAGNSGSRTTTTDGSQVTVSGVTTTGSVTTSICQGETYVWPANGQSYTTAQSGLTHTVGCNTATLNLTVNPLVTPTVSLSSSDADNTFAYGTGVTFTASASNLSGGTATYTFTVNGQTVQSGSSNTYTSSTLANANQVRASISISGGSCLTATTADSNVITNTVTGAVLTYITNFCGLTMPAIDSRIKCAVPSGVVGTLGYRFRVTNLTTNATATVDSSIANFNLTMTNIYAFGTSFSVQAAAVVNGVLQPYSAPCTITTPSLPTNQLVATSCGQTLESLNARIFASTVVGAQNYRWRVALSSAPTTYYELVTTSSSFRLTNVPNLPVSFGNTYLVAVQSDILVNGIATTTAYGTVCSVSTPSVNVVSISANQCGQTLAGITDRIFINSVPNAVNYTYRVRKVGTTTNYTFTTTATSFRLTSFNGLSLTFDSQYYVAVAASIVIDGVTFNAPFGPDCTISTPAYPTVGLQESQCSNGDPENPGAYQVTSSSELIYCEFVSGASYQFILQKLVNGTPQGSPITLDRLGNFFSINMVHGLEAGTEYLVSVKLFYYGEGPQGKDCVIRTPEAVSSTRVAAKEFAATAYPNPFENNFLVDLTTSSQAPVSLKVYDMLGRLMTSYESKSKDLSTVAIGDQFPSGVYNVVVTQGDEVKTLRVVKR
jgi:autotransporter-associated beta strand protein